MSQTNLNQTAHDCPDCGQLLEADDMNPENVIFYCNCGSKFRGVAYHFDQRYREYSYIVQDRLN